MYKQKGNKEQATKVDKALSKAQSKFAGVTDMTPAIDRARVALEKGRKLLTKQ